MYTVNLVTHTAGKAVTQTLGQYKLRNDALDVARKAVGDNAEFCQRAGDLSRPGPRRVERGYCGSDCVAWVIDNG